MHDIGALVVAALTLAAIVFGLVLGVQSDCSPAIRSAAPFFNLILLGYGIPAVLAAVLALIARETRPLTYRVDRRQHRGRSGAGLFRRWKCARCSTAPC